MESVFRVDKGQVGSHRVDDNGNLIVEGAITRTGVFTYVHRDKDGKTFTTHELRHPDDVKHPDALKSFIQVPVTDDHPYEGKVTPDNVKKYAVGNLGDTVKVDGKFVKADLIIRDAKTIAKIKGDSGKAKRELSCGYRANVIPENGEYMGQRYDHRQTNIRGNHVAIVQAGRAGPEVRLMLDSADAVLEEGDLDDDRQDAGGEGSRGGHIIGHTSSGKPIYRANDVATHYAVSTGQKGSLKRFKSAHQDWTSADHKEAAKSHKEASDKAREEWAGVQEQAHMHTFGKKPEFTDYKVSGIGRSEYSEEHKNKLRELSKISSGHTLQASAHMRAATGGKKPRPDGLDLVLDEDPDYDDNSGRRIGETRSGKHIYVGADDYDDDDWTVDDHQEAVWAVKDEHRRVREALNTIQRLGLGDKVESALQDELEELETCHKRHKRKAMTLDKQDPESKEDKADPASDRILILPMRNSA